MPYLSHLNFDTVHEALKQAARLNAEALPKFDWGKSALDANAIQLLNEAPRLVTDALALMAEAHNAVASPGLREEAHDQYGSDEIEIDDEGVGTSEGEGGVWVQAWVWIEQEEDEDEDDETDADLLDKADQRAGSQ